MALIRTRPGKAILNVASYGRRGPQPRDHFSPAQLAQISRTVRRAPEVVVKVLPRGRHDLKGAGAHLAYLGRSGELPIETDRGEQVVGAQASAAVITDWDLDLESKRPTPDLWAWSKRPPPKLFHKLTLSMPAGTPPDKVFGAARNFAREEFGLQHRYAMVLHTDEPHPHVHIMVKALGEHGQRLYIRKATLRDWRENFAEQLRALGVEANATERAVRGKAQSAKKDGIYRSALRGESRHLRATVEAATRDLVRGGAPLEAGKAILERTRREVLEGWRGVGEVLVASGQGELAERVRRFADAMPAVKTDRERIADELLRRVRDNRARAREEHARARAQDHVR